MTAESKIGAIPRDGGPGARQHRGGRPCQARTLNRCRASTRSPRLALRQWQSHHSAQYPDLHGRGHLQDLVVLCPSSVRVQLETEKRQAAQAQRQVLRQQVIWEDRRTRLYPVGQPPTPLTLHDPVVPSSARTYQPQVYPRMRWSEV